VGTGLLAMAEGISLEAMIVSKWSGKFRDYDEIFRKEDGDARVLLSFQNDGARHSRFSEPAVSAGPCLSFGLHLAGLGYRELDMPLDGIDGRPTLAEITDGKPHHVVAAYDSFTGCKAIFIDGRKRFEHVYPVGTLVRCGGPAPAEIGNTRGQEPFHGVIDEFAIYDFALTPAEVENHHANVIHGRTYFGGEPPAPGARRWQAVTRLVEGQTRAFNQYTGLPR
ncbi:MAG: LamG domain-containing protein, partial [Planctomycetia bacterium]